VVNGERRPGIALPEGAVSHTLAVPLGEPLGEPLAEPVFVRAEVWDISHTAAGPPAEPGEAGRGRCIALTNPIWYVPAHSLDAVPPERRA
jgi:hypothetical protein